MVLPCGVVVRSQPGFNLNSAGRGGAVQTQPQDCHLLSHIQEFCLSQTCHRAHTEVEHGLGTWHRKMNQPQAGWALAGPMREDSHRWASDS